MTAADPTTDLATRLERLEARVADLQAREDIRECLYRYARAVDRGDAELLHTVYHPDATDAHGHTFYGDAHAFVDFIVPALRQALTNRHAISNEQIDLDGDRAFVESLWCSTHRVPTDQGPVDVQAEGRYLDVFERRDGTWAISYRVVVNDKAWTRIVPEALRSSTATGPEGLQARMDRSDPVYLGFGITDVPVPDNPGREPLGALRAIYATGGDDA